MLRMLPALLLTLTIGLEGVLAAKGSQTESSKSGQCPPLERWNTCPSDPVHCGADRDCPNEQLCCASGCGQVCVKPLYSGCQHAAEDAERRARFLGPQEGRSVRIPRCLSDGRYDQVQCDSVQPVCWCVDRVGGTEIPGTRAPARALVNCTEPRPCGLHTCRMLCPHGFSLDPEDGCPRCQCHDPCLGVRCPGGQSCQLEEIACKEQPCPPLPTCKKGRSLNDICPAGDPLRISGSERPFLCGDTPGRPNCPPLFKCVVQSGHEYGVCCPASSKIKKPGNCPSTQEIGVCLQGHSCANDLQCPATLKCCPCAGDGEANTCVQPHNLTVCVQQRMVAELLSMSEREGRGYIPQCDPHSGHFEPKQCSRNGLVCWCVDTRGNKLRGTMSGHEKVQCDTLKTGWIDPDATHQKEREMARSYFEPTPLPETKGAHDCDAQICAQVCEYGFRVEQDTGCPTCECDDPCRGYHCEDPSQVCVVAREHDDCDGFLCPSFPTCRPAENPCSGTGPLTDPLVFCNGTMPCQEDQVCTFVARIDQAVCCPRTNETIHEVEGFDYEPKQGLCPVELPSSCQESTHCTRDSDCPGKLKCCFADVCGAICSDPVLEDLPRNLEETTGEEIEMIDPSAQATEDFVTTEATGIETTTNSIPPTMCEYLRDFADKMEGTREGMSMALHPPVCEHDGAYRARQCNPDGICWCVDEFGADLPRTRSNSTTDATCESIRGSLGCLGLTCRLGCDYGFTLDPETSCPRCQCRDPCQSVNCPQDHQCHMVDVSCDGDYCPPVPACLPAKPGQCPYLLVPARQTGTDTCQIQCTTDHTCNSTDKCCSNGCGTQCVSPLVQTACQHQRAIAEHKAREAGVPARLLHIPRCRENDGSFEPVQCHGGIAQCWCVDDAGQEVAGTRVPIGTTPQCHEPRKCPELDCPEDSPPCLYGQERDPINGCPLCKCHDPCRGVTCRGDGERCRMIEVRCAAGTGPCPPVPMCLPGIDTPCRHGHPLTRRDGSTVRCGPGAVDSCPSSHKCQLSPLGEYAVCCPKPRDVCFEPKDEGVCRASNPRWFFNPRNNRCEKFIWGGCGGNHNNFDSVTTCNTVCPVLSQCERLREKNERAAERYNRTSSTFRPRCDPETGAWLPVQCLDAVGVCWCVNRKGEPIKGTLQRGKGTTLPLPLRCSSRQARGRALVPPNQIDDEAHNPDALIEQLIKEVTLHELDLNPQSEDLTSSDSPMHPWRTRCQALRNQMLSSGAMYAVTCDEDGRFEPTQCYPATKEKPSECWCVDEAGNQLLNTTLFTKGSNVCKPTPLEGVEVYLGFQGNYDSLVKQQVEDQLKTLLASLGAKLRHNEVHIEIFPEATRVNFTVIGANKVDVAFYLEQLVKSDRMAFVVYDRVQATSQPLVADITKSRFHHKSYSPTEDGFVDENIIALENREIVSHATSPTSLITPYQTAIIMLTVSSAFIICILIVLILLYRKKISNNAEAELRNKNNALDQRFLDKDCAPIYVVALPKGPPEDRQARLNDLHIYDTLNLYGNTENEQATTPPTEC